MLNSAGVEKIVWKDSVYALCVDKIAQSFTLIFRVPREPGSFHYIQPLAQGYLCNTGAPVIHDFKLAPSWLKPQSPLQASNW